MRFSDITITGAGERLNRREHGSSELLPQAVQMMRGLIERGGGPIPMDDFAHIRLMWTSEKPGIALATFTSRGRPLTTSALIAADADPDKTRRTLRAMQGMLVRLLKPTLMEPAFDLVQVAERPVIITLVLPGVGLHPDLPLVADMETCLAGAYLSGGK